MVARLRGIVLALLVALVGLGGTAQAAEWVAPATSVRPPPEPPESWVSVEEAGIVAHGPASRRGLVEHLAAHASRSLPALAATTGLEAGGDVHVFVADSQELFLAIQPGRPPAWADATAYPGRSSVFLRTREVRGQATSSPIEQVLDHELVHVLIGRAFAPQRPPTWLQEGFAQLLSGEYGPETIETVSRASVVGRLIPLEELAHGFPEGGGRARLAYAQSADFIAWIRAEHGLDALRRTVDAVREGEDMRGALSRSIGMTTAEADQAWRARLESDPFRWFQAIVSVDAVWVWMAVLALFAVIIGRTRAVRRTRRAIAVERERERILDAVWEESFVRDVTSRDPKSPLGREP